MTQFRALIAGLVAVILVASVPVSAEDWDDFTSEAFAAEWQDFSPEAFAAAQQEGRPILIDVTAAWCSTCRAQHQILDQLAKEPKYRDLVVFKVDFDNQKDAVRALNAQRQSTLIVFKGGKELDRSVGDTSQLSIEGLLDKTL